MVNQNKGTMTVTLIGCFVFTNEGHGILNGIYHNTGHTEPYPETAKKIGNKKYTHPFEGLYRSVWIESAAEDKSDLEIIHQSDNSFTLKWFDSKKTYYEGIGFIYDGKLVGSYWQY